MPPGVGPVLRCRHCGKSIRRAWRRPEYFHVDGKNWYCWKDGKINRDEYAEPGKGKD